MARPVLLAGAPALDVHLLPAAIEYDGEANVGAYFRPTETGGALAARRQVQAAGDSTELRAEPQPALLPSQRSGAVVDGLPVLQASLRGRNLAGAPPPAAARPPAALL